MKYFFLLATFLLIKVSFAHQCVVFDDQDRATKLGSVLLGDSFDKINFVEKSKNCYEKKDGSYIDCEYTDKDGVSYLVEGTKVIRKEIKRISDKKNEYLPLGLRSGFNIKDVIDMLVVQNNLNITWLVNSSRSGGYVLSSDFCIKNENDHLFDFYLIFTKNGVLDKIGSRLNW